MRTLTLRPRLTNEETAELAGEFLSDKHFSILLDEDADVFRADGTPLLHFRKRQIRETDAAVALKALYDAATEYCNRGIAAGKAGNHDLARERLKQSKALMTDGKEDSVRFPYLKQDGTVSKTNMAITVPSGIVGAFDRQPRFPYCRLTKFTADHPERVLAAMPFIQQVNEVFKTNSPERYAAQAAVCARTHPDYIFRDTVFSTITVNKNWRTAAHRDAGDLKSGFGVLSVLSEGRYEGGYFVIPRFGVAVNLTHRDVILADVHEWHGNTELKGISKYWTRLSTVFYFRSKLVACKSLKEEFEIAKKRVQGGKMYPDFEGEFPA